MTERLSSSERLAPSRGTWVAATICILGVMILSFIAGSLLMFADREPASTLARSFVAGQALVDKMTNYPDPVATDLWRDARTDKRGVTLHDPGRARAGYTLYTSGHTQTAYLVDMQGRVAHRWHVPFSEIWDETASVKRPMADAYIYIEKATLLPNGDLLALYVGVGDTPWGYGLVRLNQHGEVVWKYLGHAHHDFDVAPDGSIYVLTQEINTKPVENLPQLKPPRVDDYLVRLGPDGRELDKVWLLGALVDSPYVRLLEMVPWYVQADGKGDYLHTNSVEFVRPGTPLPNGVAPGQVMLSFREINTVATVDLARRRIAWALPGPWIRQHDPDLLPNGNLLLFDNEGQFAEGGASRVIELNPRSGRVAWSFTGTAAHPFESMVRSSQERLANGNTLIVESDGGRLLEVTRSGDIVWEYVNPVRGGPEKSRIPIIFWAHRVEPDSLTPEFRAELEGRQADPAGYADGEDVSNHRPQ